MHEKVTPALRNAGCVLAARHREVVVTASNDTASRDNLDQYFVESNSQSDGEAARKAAREANLLSSDVSMEQLKAPPTLPPRSVLPRIWKISDATSHPSCRSSSRSFRPCSASPVCAPSGRSAASEPRVGRRGVRPAGHRHRRRTTSTTPSTRVAAAEVLGALASTRHQETPQEGHL
jgi:hypothetical protein